MRLKFSWLTVDLEGCSPDQLDLVSKFWTHMISGELPRGIRKITPVEPAPILTPELWERWTIWNPVAGYPLLRGTIEKPKLGPMFKKASLDRLEIGRKVVLYPFRSVAFFDAASDLEESPFRWEFQEGEREEQDILLLSLLNDEGLHNLKDVLTLLRKDLESPPG